MVIFFVFLGLNFFFFFGQNVLLAEIRALPEYMHTCAHTPLTFDRQRVALHPGLHGSQSVQGVAAGVLLRGGGVVAGRTPAVVSQPHQRHLRLPPTPAQPQHQAPPPPPPPQLLVPAALRGEGARARRNSAPKLAGRRSAQSLAERFSSGRRGGIGARSWPPAADGSYPRSGMVFAARVVVAEVAAGTVEWSARCSQRRPEMGEQPDGKLKAGHGEEGE